MFANLKVGDTVAVYAFSVYALSPATISRVACLTKTRAILENGDEFRLSDGQEVGFDWRGKRMTADPKIIAITEFKHDASSVKAMITHLETHVFPHVIKDNIDICRATMSEALESLKKLKCVLNEQK